MLQRSLLSRRDWILQPWWNQVGVLDRGSRIRAQQTLMAVGVVVGIVVVLSLYLYQASRVTVTEYAILEEQQQVARLQRENSNALALIAVESSIARMNERATAAGYGPPEVVRYLPTSPLVTIQPKVQLQGLPVLPLPAPSQASPRP